jgi:hypothetical protein
MCIIAFALVLSRTKAGLNSLASAEFNRINMRETANLPGHWEALSGGGSRRKSATSLRGGEVSGEGVLYQESRH